MGEKKIKYLTLEEAAELSSISVRALRKKIAAGLLTGYKPSKHVLVDAQELDMFIRRSKVVHS